MQCSTNQMISSFSNQDIHSLFPDPRPLFENSQFQCVFGDHLGRLSFLVQRIHLVSGTGAFYVAGKPLLSGFWTEADRSQCKIGAVEQFFGGRSPFDFVVRPSIWQHQRYRSTT
jgi:hypothetical protein